MGRKGDAHHPEKAHHFVHSQEAHPLSTLYVLDAAAPARLPLRPFPPKADDERRDGGGVCRELAHVGLRSNRLRRTDLHL